MSRIRARWLTWVIVIIVVAAIAWSFVPQPVSVEAARVTRGPLMVTVDEEGQTRVRDRYTVSSPVAGYLVRIEYRAGASVRAGQVVARVSPAPPTPLDVRSRSQLAARVDAAADALRQARTRVESARAALAQADRELARNRQLERDRVVAAEQVELAHMKQQVATSDLGAAVAGVDVAQHDLEAARAALAAGTTARPSGRPVDVRAPRAGTVLKVFEESERVVAAGVPLLEIGEESALEIVADLLSTDAVRVSPGARVLIDRWGGPGTLNGRVRLVEPSSFTKVSALGVEEQRVNIIIDFVDPPEAWQRLGDGFALEVHVVIWEGQNVLKVPVSALFRRGERWHVFRAEGSRALMQPVRLQWQNSLEAQVLDGLEDGDLVIVHPSERVTNNGRISIR